jgi:large subunit ribosomal protein L10
MPTAEKVEKVAALTSLMRESKALFLADFTGLDVASVTDLRNKLRKASVGYRVVKNRLAKRAAETAEIAGLDDSFSGPTALAFGNEDPVVPAKILQDFADDNGNLAIKIGLVDGQVLQPEEIKALAALPSREVLLRSVVGGVRSPLFGFAGVLNGLLRNLVGLISAVENKKRENSSGS